MVSRKSGGQTPGFRGLDEADSFCCSPPPPCLHPDIYLALSSVSPSCIPSCPWHTERLVRDSEVKGGNGELWKTAHRSLKMQKLHSFPAGGAAPSKSAYQGALTGPSQALDATLCFLGGMSGGCKAC